MVEASGHGSGYEEELEKEAFRMANRDHPGKTRR